VRFPAISTVSSDRPWMNQEPSASREHQPVGRLEVEAKDEVFPGFDGDAAVRVRDQVNTSG
jgi:hypothetical protein